MKKFSVLLSVFALTTTILTQTTTSGQVSTAARVIDEPQTLSETSLLRAEILKLKAQLAQCRIDLTDRESRLATRTLSAEQQLLEQQFRKELGCKPTDKFNWSTLKCEASDEKNPNGKD